MNGWADLPSIRKLIAKHVNDKPDCPGIERCGDVSHAYCRSCKSDFEIVESRIKAVCPKCGQRKWNLRRCEGCDVGKIRPELERSNFYPLICRASDLANRIRMGVPVAVNDLYPDEYRAMVIFLEEKKKAEQAAQEEAIKEAQKQR